MIPELRGEDRIRKQPPSLRRPFCNIAGKLSVVSLQQRCRASCPARLETGEALPR